MGVGSMSFSRAPWFTSLLLLAGGAIAHQSIAASDAKRVTLHIPPQPVGDALSEFGRQTGLTVMIQSVVGRGVLSPKLDGDYIPVEALEQLLAGTGLRYEYLDDKTVAVLGSQQKAADSPSVRRAASASGPADVRGSESDASVSSVQQHSSADASQDAGKDETNFTTGGRRKTLEEVVVTGTHIREAANVGSPLIQITSADIERSGRGTLHEVMESLPQNFGAGSNEGNYNSTSAVAGLNIGFGSGVNLRGLGNDSTLVLLNGTRLAPSGAGANFVDISTIPLAVIDHVDILTDGASAIYGSDAVGGVVNIVTRNDYQGAETRLRYGAASGDLAKEVQVGQLIGTHWQTGNVLLAYEFYKRQNLAAADRVYARNSDLTSLGGSNFSNQASNPGNILDPDTGDPAFAIPRGQDGRALQPGSLLPGVVNLQNTLQGTDLLPQQRRNSVFVLASQEIGSHAVLFGNLSYSRRNFDDRIPAQISVLSVPSTNPFYVNPFGGTDPVQVNYSFIDDFGAQRMSGNAQSYDGTAGLRVDFGSSWRGEVSGSYSRQTTLNRRTNTFNSIALDAALADPDPNTAFNPFGDGSHTNPATLAGMRGFEDQATTSRIWGVAAKADGDIFPLPGGSAKLAVGMEERKERFNFTDVAQIDSVTPMNNGSDTTGSRSITAAFTELYIPLVTGLNHLPGIERLELSLAGRLEHYNDFGSTTNPRFGLLWSPVSGLSVRGSFGKSFKAPLLSQLKGQNVIFLLPLPDPKAPSGFTTSAVVLGTNGALEPERAKTWTAGIQIDPPVLSPLKIAVNYFHVDIDERIKVPADSLNSILPNDSAYAPILTRNPSAAAVNALYADPGFLSQPIPPEQVGAIIDDRLSNVAVTNERGVDLTASYAASFGFGTVQLDFDGSYLLSLKQAFTGTAPLLETVGTINYPAKVRLRSGLSWTRGGWTAGVNANFVGHYIDNMSIPSRDIASWTTVDMQLAYAVPTGAGHEWLKGLRAAVSVTNALDRDPPFVNQVGGYDSANSNPFGRIVSVQLTKAW